MVKYHVKSEIVLPTSTKSQVEEFESNARSMDELVRTFIYECGVSAYFLNKLQKKGNCNYVIYEDNGREIFLRVRKA